MATASNGSQLLAVVITVSDRCSKGLATDESGPLIDQLLTTNGPSAFRVGSLVVSRALVPDEPHLIEQQLRQAIDTKAHLIITTGGTGFAPRDVTPEATEKVLQKKAPAFAQAIVAKGLEKTPHAALSRGIAGVAQGSLIVNLAGSPKAVRDGMEVIFQLAPHAVALMHPDLASPSIKHETPALHPDPHQAKKEPSHHSGGCCCGHGKGPQSGAVKKQQNPGRASPFPMVPLDEALQMIAKEAGSFAGKPETVDCAPDCSGFIGRILAQDVAASDPLPPFPASVKDGYALRGKHKAGEVFTIVGSVLAGSGTVPTLMDSNSACYVTTGAPIPQGADCVVMVEYTKETTEPGHFELLADVAPGDDIRGVGSDIAIGEVVLKKGTKIGPAEIAVLATVGQTKLELYQIPSVAVISTGDELVSASTPKLEGAQIRDSNKPMLLSQLRTMLGTVEQPIIDGGVVQDTFEALENKLTELLDGGAQVIFTTGGVSMGTADHLKGTLKKLGFQIHFGRVAMKPGKPCTFASVDWQGRGKRFVMALPGNPASAFVCFNVFGVPLLRALATWEYPLLQEVEARLSAEVVPDNERPELQRGILSWSKSGYEIKPVPGSQCSSRPTSLLANALLKLPVSTPACPTLAKGSVVTVMLLPQQANCATSTVDGLELTGP